MNFSVSLQASKKETDDMAEKLSRRKAMGLMGAAAAMAGRPSHVIWGQRGSYGGSTGQERGEMGRIAGAFRRQFSVPATSIAISRNGQFAYDRAAGMADREKSLQVTQSSLFRIASLSKPITSVTIFSLIEQGKLNLGDKVLG